ALRQKAPLFDHLVGMAERPRIRETGVTEYWPRTARSVCLVVGRPDHLAPLRGLGGNELCKGAGRARKSSATEFGQPRLDLGIGKAGVDLGVELVDDLSRRVPGRADPIPLARLEARQEFSHSWDA